MIKHLINKKGLTLMELIVTLAIFGMVTLVVYPMLSFAYKTSTSQLKESNQRNEVRVASTYLKSDIEYSKDLEIIDSSTLRVVNNSDETITYKVQTNADGSSSLVRQNGGSLAFKDITDAEFQVLNDHLVQANLVTDIAAGESTEFKIFRWNMTVQTPGEVDDIHDIIIRDKVFVLGNQVSITGGSTVSGADATAIFRNSVNLSGSGVQYIATKTIYVDGSVTLDGGAGIGKTDNTSSIFITGNCSVTGTGRLNGSTIVDGDLILSSPKLSGTIYVDGNVRILGGSYSDFLKQPVQIYYTGSLFKPMGFGNINAEKVASIDDIIFPNITIPPMKPANWYAERGYTSAPTSRSDMKYFGGSYTFQNNNGNTFNNVIIASKGNITISGNKHATGILYAPENEVIISGGSTFKGLIIAKKTTVSGNSHVTFEAVDIDELPF